MGIAANKFRLLFLKAHQSDLEYKIMLLFSRRKALTDQSISLATNYSNNIFQTDQHSDLYNLTDDNGDPLPAPGLLPGLNFPLPGVNLPAPQPIPTGDYEAETAVLQAMDKELEMDAERLKILLEAAKTEVDSIDKLLRKNIEKEYKTFGGS